MKRYTYYYMTHPALAWLSVVCLSLSVVLTACSDKDVETTPDVILLDTEQVELSPMNSYYTLAVSGGSWRVTATPDWATPTAYEGAADETLELYVETNDDDDDRTDTLTIAFGENAVRNYVLRQHGMLTSDDNGIVTDFRDISKTYGVGYGINVFEDASSTNKYIVKTQMAVNPNKLVQQLDSLGEADALYREPRYSSRTVSVTGNSTTALANQLSINAGVEVGISAFKLTVNGGYENTETANKKYAYAMQEIQHIVGSQYLRSGVLRYMAQHDIPVFQSSFTKLANQLAADPTRTDIMRDIIKKYGTHIITQGIVGGELKLSLKMEVDEDTKQSDIHAAVDLGTKIVDADAAFDLTNKDYSIAENTTVSLKTYGGNNTYTLAPGTSFETFQQTVRERMNIDNWVESIKDGTSLALIDIEVMPIYDLMPTEEACAALRKYIIGDYQDEVYRGDATYSGPALYKLTGYDVSGRNRGYASDTLAEIGLQVDVERTLVPELAAKELSTIIYAGEQGEVSRSRGFFVGNAAHKPCKVRFDDDGRCTVTESFDFLPEGTIVSEVFTDATGDVTLMPKGQAEMYQTRSLTKWTYLNNYRLTGYDTQSAYTGNSSLVLEDWGMTIDFKRELIPTFSKTALSTVLFYSRGDKDKLRQGVFVGSDDHRPCTFHVTDDGTYVVDDYLASTKRAANSVYIEPSGAFTVSPMFPTNTYVTASVADEWKKVVDLGALTTGIDITEDLTLTGTASAACKYIKVAGGVTVTLSDVHIECGIECDAGIEDGVLDLDKDRPITIIIADGTDNYVEGAPVTYYSGNPGISLGYQTAIIIDGERQGTGQLTVVGGRRRPGIGVKNNQAASITINGGHIKATGSVGSPGIGAAGHFGASTHSKLDFIAINGGEVVASGGEWSAAIGAGMGISVSLSFCGKIFIGSSVLSVKAYAGEGSPKAIGEGFGDYSICNEVVVADWSKVEVYE